MARQDRERWESTYRDVADERRQQAPSRFLAKHAHLFTSPAVDIAAGAGRNALYLARRGVRVHALDIAAGGLRAAMATAQAEQLPLDCVQVDLDNVVLPRAAYAGAINVRYLQRSLFPALIDTVKPEGLILVETFLIDQRQIGHPRNPDFLLRRGELAEAFDRCEILECEEGLFDDAGGPAYLGRLLARVPRAG